MTAPSQAALAAAQSPNKAPEASDTAAPVAATTSGAAWPQDAVEVGYVLDAWGVKGWIKVIPYAKDPQALFSTKRWYIRPRSADEVRTSPASQRSRPAPKTPAASSAGMEGLLKIIQAKEHGDGIVAQAQEISDRTGAEQLKGAKIFVSRQSFPTPALDEFYWVDLIGLSVVNRQGQVLGVVQEMLDTGVHSVLNIASPEGTLPASRLIPFVASYIDEVSLSERRITVDWLPEWDLS